jgi:anti-sigma-K factor RskA
VTSPYGPVSEHPLDDLAAHALDALDHVERQAIDEHLSHCAACRAELAQHRETLAALADDEPPPAAVWDRITTAIGVPDAPDPHGDSGGPVSDRPAATGLAEPPGRDGAGGAGDVERGVDQSVDEGEHRVAPVSSLADATRARRRQAPPRWVAAVAGVVIAAAIGGVVGFALGDSRGTDNIADLAQRASEQPNGVLASLTDDAGQEVARVVADDDGAYLVLDALEDLPEGRAYQLWSLTEADPVSLGMLGRDGSNTVAFRLPPTITEVAISEAPTSGDPAPDGPFRASGSVARPA